MINIKDFERWYYGSFLINRDPSATLMQTDSQQMKAKYTRIYKVCKLIIDNPDKTSLELRKEIALTYFISMRAALDWLHYAEMIIEKYKSEGLNKTKP